MLVSTTVVSTLILRPCFSLFFHCQFHHAPLNLFDYLRTGDRA